MPKLTLSFISQFNERVQPLMDGTIQPEGLELIPTYSPPSETFWRQLKFQEFEISEMSLSSYIIARSRGMDMVALPVFPSRRLFHTELAVHLDSSVKEPGDLNGKRIGVPEYQQTAALWMRGILEHDFGVSQYKVDWYMEGRGVEPRRSNRLQAALGDFLPPDPARQEPGIDAGQSRAGCCGCRRSVGKSDERHRSLEAHPRNRRRLEQGQAPVSRPHCRRRAILQEIWLPPPKPRLHRPRRHSSEISLGRL